MLRTKLVDWAGGSLAPGSRSNAPVAIDARAIGHSRPGNAAVRLVIIRQSLHHRSKSSTDGLNRTDS